MDIDIILPEMSRTFSVVGISITIYCNDIEGDNLLIFFSNLNAFGLYYWENYKFNSLWVANSSLNEKIRQIQYQVDEHIHEYEETVLKVRKREHNIDSIIS